MSLASVVASFHLNIINKWLDCAGTICMYVVKHQIQVQYCMWCWTLNDAVQVQALRDSLGGVLGQDTLLSWVVLIVNGCSIINCFFPDLPPPPPEAFHDPDDDDEKHVQSRTFKMLQDAVEAGGWAVFAWFLTQATSTCIFNSDLYPVWWGVSAKTLTKGLYILSLLEAPGSVFDRPKGDRPKPSNSALPKMYRPTPPVIKPAHSMPVAPPAPVMARPGQPQPVALPGMVQMSQPVAPPQPVRSPSQKLPSSASPAAVSPTSSPGQPEWKRTPTKPPPSNPVEETRTPFCDACGEEVL